jgi:hypothetical protein
MPTLLEVQRAMRASLVYRDDAAVAAMLAPPPSPPPRAGERGVGAADRLNIYRNTVLIGLTKALRLCFPAVERLVGADFFEGAAGLFIPQHPPGAAWLDRYGAEFPDFLEHFAPAATLAYLADVARLEWAVNLALHAGDAAPLDLARLVALAPAQQGCVSFVPHPAVSLLRLDHPADDIWRAVLDGDDASLAALVVDAGPVHLLVERDAAGVEVLRLGEPAWRFARDLVAGQTIEAACAVAPGVDVQTLLAEHLAGGRFIEFHVAEAAPGAAA